MQKEHRTEYIITYADLFYQNAFLIYPWTAEIETVCNKSIVKSALHDMQYKRVNCRIITVQIHKLIALIICFHISEYTSRDSENTSNVKRPFELFCLAL